jgi:YVTN family beta-propeller protein/VCBS repeat-containing protein
MASGKKSNARRTKGRHRRQKPRTNDSYVNWFGAGAITMGLGAAMATGQGLAAADPGSDASSSAPSNDAAGSDSASTAGSSSGSSSVSKPDAPATTVSASTPSSSNSSSPDSEPESESGAVPSSGGAQASSTPSDDGGTPTPSSSTDASVEPTDQPTAPVVIEPTAPPEAPSEPPTTEVPDATPAGPTTGPETGPKNDYKPIAAAVADSLEATPESSFVGSVATTASTADPAVPSANDGDTAVQANAVETQAVPVDLATTASPVSAVTEFVSGLLAWVGLSPGLTTTPVAPVESPALWAVLAWARRQFGQSLTTQTSTTAPNPVAAAMAVPNSPPVIAAPTFGTPDPVTGAITGMVNATDPDGDPLTYTVTAVPGNGSLMVNAATGAFIYTPSEAARLAAGLTSVIDRDTFTVTVSDGQAAVTSVVSPRIAPTALQLGTPIQVGRDPAGVAVAGDRVYVADQFDRTVKVIDATTHTVIATIPVGSSAAAVAVTPDGSRAYVTLKGAGRVAVIDTATNTITTTINVGPGPTGIAISPDGSRAYVTNTNGSTVSVINTATNTVATTIKVGNAPAAVALSPDGTRLFVTNRWNDNVSVINTATNTVVGTVDVGDSPRGVALNPDGTRAYVTNTDGTVSVINTATNTNIATITVGDNPIGVAVTPDGGLAYVANGDDTLSVINTATNTVIGTLALDPAPENGAHYIALGADGNVYITDASDRTVRVLSLTSIVEQNSPPAVTGLPTVTNINPNTGVVTGTINVTDPDGDPMYHTLTTGPDPAKGSVVVDLTTGNWTYTPTLGARWKATDINATPADQQVSFTITTSDGQASTLVNVTAPVPPLTITNIDVGLGASDHAFTPDGKYAYVTNLLGFVSVIDTATNTVTATIPVGEGSGLWSVAISPDGSHAYITSAEPQILHVIDTATNTTTDTVPLSDYSGYPIAVAVSPDGSHAYVTITNTDAENGTVVEIDTATGIVTAAIPVGEFPIGVAVSPDGTRVYVTNGGVVSVIDTASSMISTIPMVGDVGHVTLSADGTRAYVTNPGANTVSVIDTDPTSATYNTVTATIATTPGHVPWQVAVSPDGVHVYVTNEQADTMSVIDTATNTVIATIAMGDLPESVAVSPDGTLVYVVNHTSGTVSVITLG